MADFVSERFGKNVWITHHARQSMLRRNISDAMLEQIIELGKVKYHDSAHYWVYHHVPGRSDNLVCAAVCENDALIIKTVMINWVLEE